jgi:hypothetical protein
MSSVVISGDTSGSITLAAPAVAGTNTLTLPAATATLATLTTPSFGTTIGVGGATASSSGAGITFPATQSASTNANTLDDYEEGTFTPTLQGGWSTAPTSYSFQIGSYTKIGNLVYCQVRINANGAVGNATAIDFGGLPFTAGSAASKSYGVAVINYQASFNTNAGDTLEVAAGGTAITFYTNAGAVRNGNAVNVDINAEILFNVFYLVD